VDDYLDLVITAAAPDASVTYTAEMLGQVVAETAAAAATRRLRAGQRWCVGGAAMVIAVGTGVGFIKASDPAARSGPPPANVSPASVSVEVQVAAGVTCQVEVTAVSPSVQESDNTLSTTQGGNTSNPRRSCAPPRGHQPCTW
jgi:hypothetical protein